MSSRRYSNPHESKSQKFWRAFLSFSLFVVLFLLALSVAVKVTFVNPQRIASVFQDSGYTQSLYEDVKAYAEDICESAAVPDEAVKETLGYERVCEINEAYIAGTLGTDSQYTASAYRDMIDGLGTDLEQAVADMIKSKGFTVSEGVKEPEKQFAGKVKDFLTERVEIAYLDRVPNILMIAGSLDTVAVVALSVIALLLMLIIPSIGVKKYRSLRWEAYAFIGAGTLNLLLVAGVEAVKHMKQLVLYPVYFGDALMSYVHHCLVTVIIAAGVLFGGALIISTVVWKFKRDNNS